MSLKIHKKKTHKETNNACITWDDNGMNSSDEYEKEGVDNICRMANHDENEVNDITYQFTY